MRKPNTEWFFSPFLFLSFKVAWCLQSSLRMEQTQSWPRRCLVTHGWARHLPAIPAGQAGYVARSLSPCSDHIMAGARSKQGYLPHRQDAARRGSQGQLPDCRMCPDSTTGECEQAFNTWTLDGIRHSVTLSAPVPTTAQPRLSTEHPNLWSEQKFQVCEQTEAPFLYYVISQVIRHSHRSLTRLLVFRRLGTCPVTGPGC